MLESLLRQKAFELTTRSDMSAEKIYREIMSFATFVTSCLDKSLRLVLTSATTLNGCIHLVFGLVDLKMMYKSPGLYWTKMQTH